MIYKQIPYQFEPAASEEWSDWGKGGPRDRVIPGLSDRVGRAPTEAISRGG
jgi:hypothetical protein